MEVTKEEREGSLPICTEYTPLLRSGAHTLLKVKLITGRSHQIRAHLASQGHPIAGDPKYGDRKINEKLRKEFGLKSQLLHSARLCMPECKGALLALSGKEITAPVPVQFGKICQSFGLMPQGKGKGVM